MEQEKEMKFKKGDLVSMACQGHMNWSLRVGIVVSSYQIEKTDFGEILPSVRQLYDVYIMGNVMWATENDLDLIQGAQDI